MTRRSQTSSGKWGWTLFLVGVFGLTALWCAYKAHGDFGEFTGRFSVLSALWGLTALLIIWEKRSRDRAFEAGWKTICHVLDGEHQHEGGVLTGSWKGTPFRAYATYLDLGQHGGTVSEYRLSMPAEPAAPAWTAARSVAGTKSRGAHLWTVRSEVWSAEEQLAKAGLRQAIEEAEQRAVHVRHNTRLAFRPKSGEVAYEDSSGEPPCAADLVVHLDLVRRMVDVHASAVTAASHLGDPPVSP